jgi:hypothetical protein
MLASCAVASAQESSACAPQGYKVIARTWDAALGRSWVLRQDCAHPAWPARLTPAPTAAPPISRAALFQQEAPPPVRPLLVHAGDPVRLWQQDATVRIEMTGVAEQSARAGERVVVRITRQTDEAGLTVQRIPGVVRAAGDVEMER